MECALPDIPKMVKNCRHNPAISKAEFRNGRFCDRPGIRELNFVRDQTVSFESYVYRMFYTDEVGAALKKNLFGLIL